MVLVPPNGPIQASSVSRMLGFSIYVIIYKVASETAARHDQI